MKIFHKIFANPFLLFLSLAAIANLWYVNLISPDASYAVYAFMITAMIGVQILIWATLGVILWPMVWAFKSAIPDHRTHLYPYGLVFCAVNGPMAVIRAIESLPEPDHQG
jgi:hypothetical protein